MKVRRFKRSEFDPDERNCLCTPALGDCDTDHDCAGHLICFLRDKNVGVPMEIFGCEGDPKKDTTDYCIDPDCIPEDNTDLIFWGNNGKWPRAVYPFGPCQGKLANVLFNRSTSPSTCKVIAMTTMTASRVYVAPIILLSRIVMGMCRRTIVSNPRASFSSLLLH